MKKALALILVLACVFAANAAFAAQIAPLPGTNMEEELNDCTLRIGFKLDAVSETEIIADVYDEQRYDAVEVTQIAVGDVITYMGEDVTVETVEVDYSTLINGGSIDADGITLCPEGGAYLAIIEDNADYMALGSVDLPFADEMTFYHWGEDENGEIILAGATEVKASPAELLELLRAESCEEFLPAFTSVQTEDGKLFSISINYTP